MKNETKSKLIKQLATEFNSELLNLPITVLPNNDIVYEEYLIKQETNGNWELHSIESKDLIYTFFLRISALLAAKYYNNYNFVEYNHIKMLDRQYRKNYLDLVLFKHHIKESTDFDQKVIFLNRLECSQTDAEYYKKKISGLFKRNFV